MEKDLTVGKPMSVIWKFCLPLFGSIIFQQLYNLADSFVAGKFIGDNALAAVGNSYEITLIFIAFAFGCNIGCSVIVSRFFGARKYHDMKTAVFTTWIAGAVLCAVLMVLGLTLSEALLGLINTPSEIMADSKLYLDIYVWGLPFVFFYNIATGIFSAMGDSRTPFIFLACSSLANIGMDILFVASFKMGVAGVAWATFLCQGVSCVLAVLFVLLQLRKVKTEGKIKVFSWRILKDTAIIAVPSIFQQSFISVGNIIIQSMVNSFGTAVMAGYSASIKLNNLVVTSFTTLGNGISNFTSQNLGANKTDRIRPGFWSGLVFVWILCVPIVLLYMLAGKPLLLIFLEDGGSDAMSVGLQFLRIVSPFYFMVAVKIIADGVLRGGGKMIRFMITTFTELILRVVISACLYKPLGPVGIWWSWPIGWAVGTVLSACFFFTIKWNKHLPEEVYIRESNLPESVVDNDEELATEVLETEEEATDDALAIAETDGENVNE